MAPTKAASSGTERAKRSMEKHKAEGGADKHWRLSKRAKDALAFIMDETGAATEQSVVERLLLAEQKRIRRW